MAPALDERHKAQLPKGDVVRLLLDQHTRIRELFAAVGSSAGERKKELFDELRGLLAVHETAEELVVRPMTRTAGGKAIADARNEEEAEATKVLAELESLDVSDPDFDVRLKALETDVLQHAEAEEAEELPLLLEAYNEEVRRVMGLEVRAAEAVAPTHPHPSAAGSTTAQLLLGPMASIKDRAADAIKAVSHR